MTRPVIPCASCRKPIQLSPRYPRTWCIECAADRIGFVSAEHLKHNRARRARRTQRARRGASK